MKNLIYILFILFITSCSSTKKINGKYSFNNSERLIFIDFKNDSLCEVNQVFYCDNIPEKYQNTNFMCKYSVSSLNKAIGYNENFRKKKIKFRKLAMQNLTDSIPESYIIIPDYEDSCLPPVAISSKEAKLRNKIKYGIIYNLVNDTLVIYDSHITFANYKLTKVKKKRKASN